jgi:microcystin degradation protein MlrC
VSQSAYAITCRLLLAPLCTFSSGRLDLKVVIKGVVENHTCGAFGTRIPIGLSVWLRVEGIDIAACSIRTQLSERDSLTG